MKTGTGAVLRETVAAGAAEHAAATAPIEQPDMFAVPTRFHGPRAEAVSRSTRRNVGAGRPPGAVNLSTKQFREFLLNRGVSPLVALARFAMMEPHLLAAELGCTKLEAFREWRILQSELAPYLYSKVAPTDNEGNAVPMFLMQVGGDAQVTLGAPRTVPWDYEGGPQIENEQNQALSAPDAHGSHSAGSHDPAKSLADKAE